MDRYRKQLAIQKKEVAFSVLKLEFCLLEVDVTVCE